MPLGPFCPVRLKVNRTWTDVGFYSNQTLQPEKRNKTPAQASPAMDCPVVGFWGLRLTNIWTVIGWAKPAIWCSIIVQRGGFLNHYSPSATTTILYFCVPIGEICCTSCLSDCLGSRKKLPNCNRHDTKSRYLPLQHQHWGCLVPVISAQIGVPKSAERLCKAALTPERRVFERLCTAFLSGDVFFSY